MVNKFKDYMGKIKDSAAALLNDKQDEHDDEQPLIELDQRYYAQLKTWADQRNTTVDTLVSQAVHQFIALQSTKGSGLISNERKERNPLLYLDGISKSIS